MGIVSMGIVQDGRAQTVREYAPADSLSVGDTFDFSITLDRNRDYDEIIFPDSSHFTSPDVEIRSRSQFKVSEDRKSTRLNSSHVAISYAVSCLKKKIEHTVPSQESDYRFSSSSVRRFVSCIIVR